MLFQVQSHGYVAIGFSSNGGMKGADIALGWVNDGDGKVHLYDMKAIGNSAPKMDTSQDLKLIKGYQNESHTVITFQRPWQTCDTEMVGINKIVIRGKSLLELWVTTFLPG